MAHETMAPGEESDGFAPDEDDRDEEVFDEGVVDEDNGALGFGGYDQTGDNDPLVWEPEPNDFFPIDGMGPDGE